MKKFLSEYGMVLVLLLLCLLFSVLTLKKESATGAGAAGRLADDVVEAVEAGAKVFVVGAANKPSAELAQLVADELETRGLTGAELVVGDPRGLRQAWDASDPAPSLLVASGGVLKWTVLADIVSESSGLRVITPEEKWTSSFLKRGNLLAIVERTVVIAVIAIGMTLVILTGGIDLSVGSLIALSAVIGTLIMKALGGPEAPGWAVWVGFAVATLSCGLIGATGGWLVAQFRVAPFITTLAIMMVARGAAFMLTGGFSVHQVPPVMTWLGRGSSLGVPNTVILLVTLYTAAHVFMRHTRYGRYIYAVGGNERAALLSGVPIKAVLVLVYLVSGLCAGFGGCIQASFLESGAPNLGMMFELYVIAAVVVGGTSLSGGSGRIIGTLIGAFIISVIQNGMNLLGFDSYLQQVVLGAVILAAVLLDKARGKGAFGGR